MSDLHGGPCGSHMFSKWADNVRVHVCVCACVLFGDLLFIKHVLPHVCQAIVFYVNILRA